MSYHALALGANVVTLAKDGRFCAMTCAWATTVDYDKIVLLIGSQSETGNMMAKGDVIGVSALAESQGSIAEKIGSVHSLTVDKKSLAQFEQLEGAFVVRDAKTQNKCIVVEDIRLPGLEEDHLIYARIVAHRENTDSRFYIYSR